MGCNHNRSVRAGTAKTTLCALLALLAPPAGAAEPPALTEAEIRALVAHGPWPVPLAADPGNRVSGKREAVEFGERLFFDIRMSGSGKFSCGTCHVPERNWTDNQTRGAAAAEVDRNTPTACRRRASGRSSAPANWARARAMSQS